MKEVGPIEWELFEKPFLDRFFPFNLMEAKMQDLINLKQGSTSVQDYFLKFAQLSKYASTLVENSRAKMNHFIFGVS